MPVTILPPAADAGAVAVAPTILITAQPVLWDFALGTAGAEQKLCQNDCEMAEGEQQIVYQTRTASGTLVRDFVTSKRAFQFSYSWLPGKQEHTYDGGMGRDELLALYRSGSTMSFHLPREGQIFEDVTVMFGEDSWQAKLIERDGMFGWTWAVAFTLIEV